MHELSEGFVVLPGGLGTFEEFFEVLTWAQLGLHRKPIVVLDIDGYYRPLIELLDHAESSGFMRPADRDLVSIVDSTVEVIDTLTRAWESTDLVQPLDGPAVLETAIPVEER
jgi:uncharacterized protein (TIGR00730 family)